MKVERKLGRFETRMERKWVANVSRMDHEWSANGTRMERIYGRLPNAFPVRLFLSSTVTNIFYSSYGEILTNYFSNVQISIGLLNVIIHDCFALRNAFSTLGLN